MRSDPNSWLNTLARLAVRPKRRKGRTEFHGYHRRPRLESLEQRYLLSITVDTLIDENDGINSGGVSLRDAVAYAATQPGTDTIEFDPSLADGVINFLYGQITIDSDLEIIGLGHDKLTIDAQGNSRVLLVNSGVTVTISDLTIAGGGGVAYGGGIHVNGNLTLNRAAVLNNAAAEAGGGIYVWDTGTLNLLRTTVTRNPFI